VIGTMGAKFVYGLMYTDQARPISRSRVGSSPLHSPGSYLMCFRFLQVAFAYWRTGELPHHDHAMSRASRWKSPHWRRGGHALTSVIIFTLLIALMLTGMPISIALRHDGADLHLHHDNVPTESVR